MDYVYFYCCLWFENIFLAFHIHCSMLLYACYNCSILQGAQPKINPLTDIFSLKVAKYDDIPFYIFLYWFNWIFSDILICAISKDPCSTFMHHWFLARQITSASPTQPCIALLVSPNLELNQLKRKCSCFIVCVHLFQIYLNCKHYDHCDRAFMIQSKHYTKR